MTVLFWIVKILSTTVGETAADFLNGNLGLGFGYFIIATKRKDEDNKELKPAGPV